MKTIRSRANLPDLLPLRGGLLAVAETLAHWLRRARERKELAALDERTLRDIGLSRYDALAEARKPFWQP